MKKKLLFALVLIIQMLTTGCSSAEDNAREEIKKRCDVLIAHDAVYTIDECIYAADNDSCFIFSGKTKSDDGGSMDMEYLYRQTKGNLLIGLKFVEFNGSLLRNVETEAASGSGMDDIVNAALESSGLGLSATIYGDLRTGSLLDITDPYKVLSKEVGKSKASMPDESITIREIGTDSIEVKVN